jgi:hypothetical protein
MNRIILLAKATCVAVVLVAAATGCSNSSGSLGKGKLSILNVLSVEGEGIAWDNRVSPQPAPGMPKDE